MSIELKGDNEESLLLPMEVCELQNGARLVSDCFNEFHWLQSWFQNKKESEQFDDEPFTGQLRQLLHYRERYAHSGRDKSADALVEKSDPEAIAAFDALVDEFNENIDSMTEELATNFRERAKKIIYGNGER